MKRTSTAGASNPRKQRLEHQIAALEAALDEIGPDVEEADQSHHQRLTAALRQKRQLLKAITWR